MADYDKVEQKVENILKSVARQKNIKYYEFIVDKNPSKGDGFLSEIFTGKVLNKDNGETTNVVIKNAIERPLSIPGGNVPIFKREVYFYTELFPELDKFQRENGVEYPFDNIPTYLVGSTDIENLYIAMENLKTMGYVLFDKKKYFDRKHLELTFKTYGKFHALSFNLKHNNTEHYKNLMEKISNLFDEIFGEGLIIEYITKGYTHTLEMFDPVAEADILAQLKMVENVGETFRKVQVYNGNYSCLTHGDCWSNNMLYKYKESGELEDIKILDFQSYRPTTPIYDLSYFFYTAASKEDMDKLDYYLDLYYESFANFTRKLGGNPEELLPFKIFKEEWKQYALFGILIGFEVWSMKLLDKEVIIDLLSQNIPPEKFRELCDEKRTEIFKGPEFRERARNLCLHAIEYGIL